MAKAVKPLHKHDNNTDIFLGHGDIRTDLYLKEDGHAFVGRSADAPAKCFMQVIDGAFDVGAMGDQTELMPEWMMFRATALLADKHCRLLDFVMDAVNRHVDKNT